MQKTILATNSARHLGLETGGIKIGRFPGGEVSLAIEGSLAGREVFIIGSTNAPSENLVEILLAIDTAGRLGASKITLIVPYFGYSRADREKFPGESVSAETVIKVLESVGGKDFKIKSVDIHSERVKNFFRVPFENIEVTNLLAEKFSGQVNLTVVAPDKGAILRAGEFAERLATDRIAVLQKERAKDGSVKIKGITGEIGERIVIVDDIVDTGGTILKSIEFLKTKKVEEIHLAVTHMVYAGGGWKTLAAHPLVKKIVTTNTIKSVDNLPDKFEVVDISKVILRKIGRQEVGRGDLD